MANLKTAQMAKSLPAMQETWVQSLGQEEDPGEGNGNPLQYPCLENPMDSGAWWAAIYGIAQSQTQLKQLGSSSSRPSHLCQYDGCANTISSMFVTRHSIGSSMIFIIDIKFYFS